MKIDTRAKLIRQDWRQYDLSPFTDNELVKVWSDWFLSEDANNNNYAAFIEDLRDEYPDRVILMKPV